MTDAPSLMRLLLQIIFWADELICKCAKKFNCFSLQKRVGTQIQNPNHRIRKNNNQCYTGIKILKWSSSSPLFKLIYDFIEETIFFYLKIQISPNSKYNNNKFLKSSLLLNILACDWHFCQCHKNLNSTGFFMSASLIVYDW